MKTDRELLELAAKAAGVIGHFANNGEDALIFFDNPKTPGMWGVWNPLTDDGDALRLAVKVGAWPVRGRRVIPGDWSESIFIRVVVNGLQFDEIFTDDPYAATRRAIVRAAAEIGSQS